MEYPTTRFVFDRKKVATKKRKGLVQIEILFRRKRKWLSTGIKVYADQWNEHGQSVKNSNDMVAKNQRLLTIKNAIDEYINWLIRQNEPFTWEMLERFLNVAVVKKETFADYIKRRIDERTDIGTSTKKNHRKIIAILDEYGKIKHFSDLTKANIQHFQEWLQGRKVNKITTDGTVEKRVMSQQTVWGYMKVLKCYIHDAIANEVISSDPSVGVKVKRGNAQPERWLTEKELAAFADAELSSGSLVRVRDLFLVQCYAGLAYSDLMDFRPEKITEEDGLQLLSGRRCKTGEQYIVVVLPELKKILEKYDYQLPKYSIEQYNNRLKTIAQLAKIDKPISSHWGRRTCGFLMAKKGYSIEIIARTLGHSDIRTTQAAYAKYLNESVIREYRRIEEKEKGEV